MRTRDIFAVQTSNGDGIQFVKQQEHIDVLEKQTQGLLDSLAEAGVAQLSLTRLPVSSTEQKFLQKDTKAAKVRVRLDFLKTGIDLIDQKDIDSISPIDQNRLFGKIN